MPQTNSEKPKSFSISKWFKKSQPSKSRKTKTESKLVSSSYDPRIWGRRFFIVAVLLIAGTLLVVYRDPVVTFLGSLGEEIIDTVR